MGKALFSRQGCADVPYAATAVLGPQLGGLFGKTVPLQDGSTRRGRRRLPPRVDPQPAGAGRRRAYQPIMPTFQGQVSEEDVMQLIAYIKSLALRMRGAD